MSDKTLGRTILQKLCYFAEAAGAPLPFRFEIHPYGPFSQEVFEVTENPIVDDVIGDKSSDPQRSDYAPGGNLEILLNQHSDELAEHKSKLDNVAKTFSELSPKEMELVSTIHYIHTPSLQWHKQRPSKESVVDTVYEIKKSKFDKHLIGKVYDILQEAGLLPSANAAS